MTVMSRREDLLAAATDQVLAHGLIGLTLRPLASAIGTSDRMLIYHFGSHDALIAAVVHESGERATECIGALPGARGVRAGVNRLWQALRAEPLNSCIDVYCQAAVTGLIGREPYLSEARASNAQWYEALSRYFERCGAPRSKVARVVSLVDSALFGFHLDLITDRPDELDRAVDDLARAAAALAAG